MIQKQGYPAKSYSVPTKRYCQTLSLKDNPALIAAGVGRLCSPFSRMRAGKHIIPKVEADGADVLFV